MIKSSFKAQPFLVRNTILSRYDKRSFTEYTQVIETVSKNKVFLEQLLLANPKLYDVMQKYNAGLLKKKRVKKLFESIYKYYKRSYLRSTPFGLFSETSIGVFSKSSQYKLMGKTTKGIRLDTQWLIRLVHKMEVDFSKKLSFTRNNANYMIIFLILVILKRMQFMLLLVQRPILKNMGKINLSVRVII